MTVDLGGVGACRYCRHKDHDECKQIGWTDSVCCSCECKWATIARSRAAEASAPQPGAAPPETAPTTGASGDDTPSIQEVITDLRDHASDALAEIGEPGAPWPYALRDEHDSFTRVANWLVDRYNVTEEPHG